MPITPETVNFALWLDTNEPNVAQRVARLNTAYPGLTFDERLNVTELVAQARLATLSYDPRTPELGPSLAQIPIVPGTAGQEVVTTTLIEVTAPDGRQTFRTITIRSAQALTRQELLNEVSETVSEFRLADRYRGFRGFDVPGFSVQSVVRM